MTGSILLVGSGDVKSGTTAASKLEPLTGPTTNPTSGMRLVFSDDFEGPSLDTSRWATCYPWANDGNGCTNFGNPELQWYLPSQVQVADGSLRIAAARAKTPGTTAAGAPLTFGWRSGMVTTADSVAFTYGYVEVSAKAPRGDGFWSALWLLPEDQSHPPEIDIAELYGTSPDSYGIKYHPVAGDSAGGTVEEGDVVGEWHTFGVDWQPDSITWYYDGRVAHRYNGPTPAQPMYLLLNLAIADFFNLGPTEDTPASAVLEIRDVAIYQR